VSLYLLDSLVLEGQKFAQVVVGVQEYSQTLIGVVPMGKELVTSGNVTDEVSKEYIRNKKTAEPDDDFEVVVVGRIPDQSGFHP
jgi:hypothetical protein